MFLGYPHGTKGYKIFYIYKRKIIVSRDTKFHEDIFHFPIKSIHENEESSDFFNEVPTHFTQENDYGRQNEEFEQGAEKSPSSPRNLSHSFKMRQ